MAGKTVEATGLSALTTEQVNASCAHIDEMSTLDALRAINAQDHGVADAVEAVLPKVAALVDDVAERLRSGGRLIYVGAGTSGRLGILDASECPPTYGASPEMVQGVLAGGRDAFWQAVEGAEDSPELGAANMKELGICPRDAVVGLAASGRTPYVIGALDAAHKTGALTGAISCVAGAELSSHAEHAIECVTGAEAICGSTRMKAGTAQKMILNMISTEVMVKLGKVYGNLMVDVRPTNEKLVARAVRIVAAATGRDAAAAQAALETSSWDVKVAILTVLLDRDANECRAVLKGCKGNISAAIRSAKEASKHKS